jgi:hypothetical protein
VVNALNSSVFIQTRSRNPLDHRFSKRKTCSENKSKRKPLLEYSA